MLIAERQSRLQELLARRGISDLDTLARMLADDAITDLFWATIEATEEAILNALVAAETMVGRDGIQAFAIPHEELAESMTRYGRGPARMER